LKIKTRDLTITAVLAAICLLLGLTPIGYIQIPPIAITLMCIPVIVGTITQGLRTGLILGFVFGLTSFLTIFLRPTPFSQFLFNLSPWKTIIVVFVPRMFIPVTTWLVYKVIGTESKSQSIDSAQIQVVKKSKIRGNVATGIAAFVGSMTNTVLFLGALYLIFLPEIDELAAAFGASSDTLFGVVAGIGAINGLPEAAVALLLSIPIVYAISKIKRKQRKQPTES
jgi:uncharacterized membrane protein